MPHYTIIFGEEKQSNLYISSMIEDMASWKIESIPAFCVTLERRKDRWKRFQDQPGIQPLGVKRFIGVDGKTLDIKKDKRIATLTKRSILRNVRRSHEELDSPGGVGCALSHIAIWQWMVDNQQEVCMVMEDDAVVPDDFVTKANACIQQSVVLKDSKQWDIWLIGGLCEGLTRIPQEPVESGVVRVGAFILAHCYIITLRTATKFLEDVYPIHAHIDFWMSIYSYLNDIRIVHNPQFKLIQDDTVKTDIQNEQKCAVCNIPEDYKKTQTLISHTDLMIARGAEVVCVGLLGYWLYRRFIR
jgi:GR25 family glycosyltransferase involved in LPS biosynthesis